MYVINLCHNSKKKKKKKNTGGTCDMYVMCTIYGWIKLKLNKHTSKNWAGLLPYNSRVFPLVYFSLDNPLGTQTRRETLLLLQASSWPPLCAKGFFTSAARGLNQVGASFIASLWIEFDFHQRVHRFLRLSH
ncbi:hypothetical protein LXL04_019118 [Taraxacum kok-saghyz]